MLKRTMTYTDYNGEDRTEDFYFNLSKAELMEMELGTEGGLYEQLQRIIAAKDQPTIVMMFKEIILKAYGKKSPDGRRFMKSPEISREFSETEAYVNLFSELAVSGTAAAEFINGIIPQNLKAANSQVS